jgi:hypothetical protein
MKSRNFALSTGALIAALSWAAQSQADRKPILSFGAEIRAAHEAFLENRLLDMNRGLKAALMKAPDDEGLLQNTSKLLRAARKRAGNEALPVDWRLPTEVSYLKLAVNRISFDRPAYRMQMNLDVPNEEDLEQVKLTRYPEDVIIDKVGSIGEMSVEEGANGESFFWFGTDYEGDAPKDGLYLLDIKIKDKPLVQGWVILNDLVASQSPRVFSPAPGTVVRDSHPTFDFENFRTPEYVQGQRRNLSLRVRVSQPGSEMPPRWEAKVEEPALTRATLGVAPTVGEGLEELSDGDHRLHVIYEERMNFGPVLLGRQAASVVPFRVRR